LHSVPIRGSYRSKSRRDGDEARWLSLTDAVEKRPNLLGVVPQCDLAGWY
jgi:hypothetical protein